ncbi:serine hydrolase domain-containing protein [Marinicella sediminis]|uniref:Serine hydrolase domain-containing protein n=1 Tax=Marinicella sediminis TaxID=1792834 RepID=A0ABV7J734_9GAMM|nr:serine hydrolase domain-containing protein [Marinicella sediminis]
MKRILPGLLVLVMLSACVHSHKPLSYNGMSLTVDGCQSSNTTSAQQAILEHGLRSQVKFADENEPLYSIAEQLTAHQIPALSVAVIDAGRIAWTGIYNSGGSTLNCDSLFQAASLSKPVTLMAVVRMHSEGLIDMDKDIQAYLEHQVLPQGLQTTENPVTFRNLLGHTSGITPGGYEGYAQGEMLPSDVEVLTGAAGVNSPAIEVVAVPNEQLMYSGGAYTLAELALQDVFNDTFSNIMKRWILQPLEMGIADFSQPLPAIKSSQAAQGHDMNGAVVPGGWRNHPEQAAAGLWSNASDLAKFLIEMHHAYQGGGKLFTQRDIELLLNGERHGQAYGFIINRTDTSVAITHFGGNVGYRTGMTIDLVSGDGLVYLTNSDSGGNLGNELLYAASQIYDWQHFKQTTVKRAQVETQVLKGLSGDYTWNQQVDLQVKYDESVKQIALYFPNGDAYQLVPITGEALDFIHAETGVRVAFDPEDGLQSFLLYGQQAVKK